MCTPGQTMQQFHWQEDMQSGVHLVRKSLCTLLPGNVAANGGDKSSHQP